MSHRRVDRLLRELVELLHRFALDVDLAGFPQDAHESRLIDLARNDLCGKCQTCQKCGEVSGSSRIQALFVENVLLNRRDLTHVPPRLETLAYSLAISEQFSFHFFDPSRQA